MLIRKHNATIMVLVCVVLVLVWYGNRTSAEEKAVRNPETCKGCHEMQPAYYTWKSTAHSAVNCLNCHQKIDLSGMRYRHWVGFISPVKLKKPLANGVCQQCHTENRLVTPPGDLVIPHMYHVEKGVDCVDCHNNVVHANAVEKVLQPGVVSAAAFSSADSQRLTARGNRVTMSKCFGCHNGVKATKACAACHTVERMAAWHQAPDFAWRHGSKAAVDLVACDRCHGEDLVASASFKPVNGSREAVLTFARSNRFCQDCHRKRPVTHGPLFTIDHAAAAAVDKTGCYVCHDAKQPAAAGAVTQPATGVYCYKCHETKHPANWTAAHGASAVGSAKAKCLVCHDELTSCTACHRQVR